MKLRKPRYLNQIFFFIALLIMIILVKKQLDQDGEQKIQKAFDLLEGQSGENLTR